MMLVLLFLRAASVCLAVRASYLLHRKTLQTPLFLFGAGEVLRQVPNFQAQAVNPLVGRFAVLGHGQDISLLFKQLPSQLFYFLFGTLKLMTLSLLHA